MGHRPHATLDLSGGDHPGLEKQPGQRADRNPITLHQNLHLRTGFAQRDGLVALFFGELVFSHLHLRMLAAMTRPPPPMRHEYKPCRPCDFWLALLGPLAFAALLALAVVLLL